MTKEIPSTALFAFNTVFKTMEVFATRNEAIDRVPGLEIAEGDWLFFAANGASLDAVFSTDPVVQAGDRWVLSNGVYDLQAGKGADLPAFLFDLCTGTDGVWMQTLAELKDRFALL